jgi:hypothetical protein
MPLGDESPATTILGILVEALDVMPPMRILD